MYVIWKCKHELALCHNSTQIVHLIVKLNYKHYVSSKTRKFIIRFMNFCAFFSCIFTLYFLDSFIRFCWHAQSKCAIEMSHFIQRLLEHGNRWNWIISDIYTYIYILLYIYILVLYCVWQTYGNGNGNGTIKQMLSQWHQWRRNCIIETPCMLRIWPVAASQPQS